MLGLGALPRVVATSTAIAVLGACEVRGLIGSNADDTVGGVASTTGNVVESTGALTTAVESGDEGHGETHHEETGVGTTEDVRFDVGYRDVPELCEAPMLHSCDASDGDPWHALGLECPGSETVDGNFVGDPTALVVHHGMLGTSGVFAPREGERFVILSTGAAGQLSMTPAELAAADPPCFPAIACPNTGHGPTPRSVLPPPLDVRRVSDKGVDCSENLDLVGTGDCSNTLYAEWLEGQSAFDYAELRMTTTVPDGVDGLAYDFAFFSAEYPTWANHSASNNDVYVAWLDSERWTGNISFDELGNPITANSAFLDYRDAPTMGCPGCDAPELAGFAMEGHAGTKWLVTNAPVSAGEKMTLVFAIFDMRDEFYDSAVILDNFQWTCSSAPPFTAPSG
ncbi:MAG: choice-of-anchor L domain-containing protein [Deltaproteobacteria bacterium]|nr:choice-of-anchor L domain-containing protein [Nannocystaceae bacterium]